MGDGNSWCTCRPKLPQGWNTDGCPVHDRDEHIRYVDREMEVLDRWLDLGLTDNEIGWFKQMVIDGTDPMDALDKIEQVRNDDGA